VLDARQGCGRARLRRRQRPWHELRYRHLQALRSRWQTEFAPATANKYISAVRGVLKQAWKLGTIGSDDYRRAASVENVRGKPLKDAVNGAG